MGETTLPLNDRHHAGRVLAGHLAHYAGQDQLLVLGLPRGGVPVAFEVARALAAPLDILVVRKLGLPGHDEYAMGAIASGGVRVMTPLNGLNVTPAQVAEVVAREQDELVRREQLYRGQHPPLGMEGRTVIVVDDGLATGASMRAAVLAARHQHPARLVVAVPVGARDSCQALRNEADEVVCAAMPQPFRAVGLWYKNFLQTSDEEVIDLLDEARRTHELALKASVVREPPRQQTLSPEQQGNVAQTGSAMVRSLQEHL